MPEGIPINPLLFQGKLVRLSAEEPEKLGELFSRWGRNSEYSRLLASDPAPLWSARKIKEWLEKALEEGRPWKSYLFFIRTLADDRLIGFVELAGIQWNHGEGWVGIGLGEREYWSKGYGTDALRVLLRYAFTELNLHRVSLDVFEYNPRAIRAYEKAGFVQEGRARQLLNRDGKRWDLIYMGILRQEWKGDQ